MDRADRAVRAMRRLAFLFSGLSLLVTASTGPQSDAGFLWVAESQGLLNIATDSGESRFEVPHPGGFTTVAINDVNGDVWAIAGRNLHGFTRSGDLVVTSALPPQAAGEGDGENPADIVVDGISGNLWISRGPWLFRLDFQGQEEQRLKLPHPIRALALDRLRSKLWITQKSEVLVYDAAGTLMASVPVGQNQSGNSKGNGEANGLKEPYDLSYDRNIDQLWVSLKRGLHRYDESGTLTLSLPNLERGELVADGTGGVWIARDKVLVRLDESGAEMLRIEPFSQGKQIVDLAADPGDASVWVASQHEIKHLAVDGQTLHALTPDLGDGVIRKLRQAALYADQDPPEITITRPQNGALLNDATPTFELTYFDLGVGINQQTVRLASNQTLDATCATTAAGATCDLVSPLPEGEQSISATVRDLVGNTSVPANVSITIDTVPPEIALDSPPENHVTNQSALTIRGRLNEPSTLVIDEDTIVLDENLSFSIDRTLQEGVNTYLLSAQDHAGNRSTLGLTVTLDTVPPEAPVLDGIVVGEPEQGQVSVSASAGTVEPHARVVITNQRTGASVTVTANADGSFAASVVAESGDTLTIQAIDVAGNVSDTRELSLGPPPPPLAPPLETTGSAPLSAATEFLYSGPEPIQVGVAAGTIDAAQAGVIRGRVLQGNGAPLAGVTISLKDRPEFGYTVSREDGMFDMAVNAGGDFVVDYVRPGYLPVQRRVRTKWRDFSFAPDVVMLVLDSASTVVTLPASNNEVQVAQGSVVSDADGTRRATVMFPPGVSAEMVNADGTASPLSTLTVRATEYTVGANGPKAMPGALPQGSGYTYAVELSVDEAMAAGATSVRFSAPVPVYVDNFLEFPVGAVVPTGWYDRNTATWVPSPNGRIVKLLGVSAGRAVLDVDGSGSAATSSALAALGVTDNELVAIAETYSVGQSMWRVPLDHFSPWDCNWPFGPPPGAEGPDVQAPESEEPDEEPECEPGSIIECQNMVLGESVSIEGTDLSLHYRSDRVPGRKTSFVVDVPLTGAAPPSGLKRIDLTILIAGQRHVYSVTPAPNKKLTFVWDGKDGYGRLLNSTQIATIILDYIYPAVYYPAPADFEASFARVSNVPGFSIGRTRRGNEITLQSISTHTLGTQVNSRSAGLGSWTLSVHHSYDRTGQVVHLGSGGDLRSGSERETYLLAGRGTPSYGGDGGPAKNAWFRYPRAIAYGADGSLYIADTFNYRVRKVAPTGIITTVAGTGINGYSGDGGPATNARISEVAGVAVSPSGELYFSDYFGNFRIRKVSRDGTVSTIAGGRPSSCSTADFFAEGYGVARCVSPGRIHFDHEGSLLIAQVYPWSAVRKITADGRILTVLGGGADYNTVIADGVPARNVNLNNVGIEGLATAPNGDLYVSSRGKIFRIGPDGVIRHFAGTGLNGFEDGVPARTANINPGSLEFDRNGNLYFIDRLNARVRVIDSAGIVSTLFGTGIVQAATNFVSGTAAAAVNARASALAVGPGGDVALVIDENRIVAVRPDSIFPDSVGTVKVVSPAGDEIYEFAADGRHMRTLDATTTATRYEFAYGESGQLTEITNQFGKSTTIERADGGATAILGPYGQRTELALNEQGYLSEVMSPTGRRHQMQYGSGGLLARFIDPREKASEFTYDAEGRLQRDTNAASGFWDVRRSIIPNGWQVSMTSAEGRTTVRETVRTPANETLKRTVHPDQTVTQLSLGQDGSRVETLSDGTRVTSKSAPDPRFGLLAQYPNSIVTTTPSGLSRVVSIARTATLANASDPLSHNRLEERVTINGKLHRRVYTTADRKSVYTSPAGRQQTVFMNQVGQPAKIQTPGWADLSYGYDGDGRLTSVTFGSGSEARVTNLRYAGQGHLTELQDAEGQLTGFELDLAGRVTKHVLTDGGEISFSYDANGGPSSITPPGREPHRFTYTAVGRQNSYSPPWLDDSDPATRYLYNLDSDLVRIERPVGDEIAFAYDAGGRLSRVDTSAGIYERAYKPGSGLLDSISAPGGTLLSYSYDGFLLTGEVMVGDVSGAIAWTYDSDFRVIGENVNGVLVSFAYDNDNLLTQAGDEVLTRNVSNGLLTGTSLGNTSTTYSYNGFGEVTTEVARFGAEELFQVHYAVRDKLGRIREKSETIQGQTSVHTYDYDAAGRLASVAKDGTTVSTYVYDSNGNRLFHNATEGAYDAQDRQLTYGNVSYAYTANGELLSKNVAGATTAYGYDALGNLRTVSLPGEVDVEYVIDGRNRRVGKKVNGHLVQGFLYGTQLEPVAELDGSGGVVSRFVYGTRPHVPDYMVRSGETYRIFSDHLGSPRLVVNASTGTVVQRMDYDEFGNVIFDSNPGFQPFGFAGGLYDQHTRLTRFGARDYDAETGRWTAKDPMRFDGAEPNFYAYTVNDPLTFIDPEGEKPRRPPRPPRQGSREQFNPNNPYRTGTGPNEPITPALSREEVHRALEGYPMDDAWEQARDFSDLLDKIPDSSTDRVTDEFLERNSGLSCTVRQAAPKPFTQEVRPLGWQW